MSSFFIISFVLPIIVASRGLKFYLYIDTLPYRYKKGTNEGDSAVAGIVGKSKSLDFTHKSQLS